MAYQTTTTIHALNQNTINLLKEFAQYVDEIDGVEGTLVELADSLIEFAQDELDMYANRSGDDVLVAAALESHRSFQAWRKNPTSVLLSIGWQACAERNNKKNSARVTA